MVAMLRTPKNTVCGVVSLERKARCSGSRVSFRDCILLAYRLLKWKLKFMDVRIILFNVID